MMDSAGAVQTKGLLRRTQCCQPALDLLQPMGRNGKR